MGFNRLILIAPQCELGYPAQQSAATGQFALQNRVNYSSWQDFLENEPEGIKIALTARDGRGRDVKDFKETLHDLKINSPYFTSEEFNEIQLYLIFGPEDWGLSAHDLSFCNICSYLPTYGKNSSLNIAHAVLLSLFIVRQFWGGTKTVLDGQVRQRDHREIKKPINPSLTIKNWLEELGFDLSNPKTNAFTVLHRSLMKNTPTSKELLILENVLQQNIRKLKELKRLKCLK